MLTNLLLAALAAGPVAAEPAKEPPAKLELFAREDWYTGQKGKEEEFVGVLMFKDRGKGVVGFGRFNPYTLVMADGAKTTEREVYVGGKPDLLKPYVGKKLKLTGKAVDMEVEGRDHHEIWPARLEVVPAEKQEEKKPDARDPPAKADILANHKLYKMEPGNEKEYIGVIQKDEKGGYTLLMQAGKAFGKMNLSLYADAGDPLAPYVGKKVRLTAKHVAGTTGKVTFEFILPARLEVIEEKQEQP